MDVRTCHILVTGGAGFIGSHTVDLLVKEGHRVSVLDNFSTGKRANLEHLAGHASFLLAEGDVRSDIGPVLARAVERHGPINRICHLAAQTSVQRSIDDPVGDIETNLSGTVRLLEYARSNKVAKVVFASSAAVYDNACLVPVSEDSRVRPSSPYGINKRSAELFLDFYARIHGLDFTILRFMNVYGARQDPSSSYSGVISVFLDRAVSGKPVVIYGDGGQTRDFVHVSDVARAVATACVGDLATNTIVNIGTGTEVSINQLAHTIIELAESSSEVRHAEQRKGEIRRSVTVTDRAAAMLGFKPHVDLRDGLTKTLAWFRAGAR